MANVLPKDKQIAIISMLAEGSSMRAISRITGIHGDTVCRLGVRIGQGCARLLDAKMHDLTCHYLQFDEIWGFIGKKEKHLVSNDDPTKGDVWTFCAIDAETKLMPAFKIGKRNHLTANAFVSDVASRLKNRPQISTDGLHIVGRPDMDLVSTSHIERLNGTTRLHMRRLTRLTYAFSKKLENFEAAVALHFAYYNLVKTHGSIKCTPAMAAGVERSFWTVADLVEAAS